MIISYNIKMYIYLCVGISLLTLVTALTLTVASKIFGATKLSVPGPIHFPLIGSTYEFIKNKPRFYDWMLDNAKKYGSIFYFSILTKPPYIVATDPQHVKRILKDNMDNYHREPIYQVCSELLGNGIFNVDGPIWKKQRQIASHMFSTKKLNDKALESFKICTKKLKKRIKFYSKNNIKYDIKDLFFRLTMDSICLIAFDYNVGCLDHDNMPEFAVAIDKCTKHLFNRMVNPLWRINKIVSLQDEVEYSKNIQLLDNLCYKIIRKRRQDKKEGNNTHNDILSLFMDALENIPNDNNMNIINNYQETALMTETTIDDLIDDTNDLQVNDNEPMEVEEPTEIDKYLRDIIFSFIIAGRDTTASTLSWLFYELLTKPDIVNELMIEIETFNLDIDNANINDYGFYKKIESAFLETLRLHPPVPFDVKYAKKDDVLISSNEIATFIPKNSTIIYSPYIMGRNPQIWGPDYNEFRLDRDHKSKTQFEFPCFNAGPRLCLGKIFAILEAKVIASELLKNFTFKAVDEEIFKKPAKYSFGITSTLDHKLIVTSEIKVSKCNTDDEY